MNYIRELNAFYDWLETNSVSLSAFALWHVLMHIANKCGWPDEFAVAVSVLCAKTKLSPRAVYDARNELRLKDRLEWRSRRGNQSAVYRLIPLYAPTADNHAGKSLSAISAGNRADNGADSHADKRADNGAPLTKLNETRDIITSSSEEVTPGGPVGEQEKITNADLIGELAMAYRDIIPAEKQLKGDFAFMGRLYNQFGYEAVLAAINEMAYKISAGFVPDKPLIYLRGIVAKGGGGDGKPAGNTKAPADKRSLEYYRNSFKDW